MELWVKVGEEKRKLVGSLWKVSEEVSNLEGEVKILSIHAPSRERRRVKKLIREKEGNVREAFKELALWFRKREARKIRRRIKELKKRAVINSKGERYYRPSLLKEIEKLEERLSSLNV